MILLIMNSLINDSSEKTLSLRPFTQPHLACICYRFVVGHFNAVYSSNTTGRLRGLFQPNHFFKCGRLPWYSARSLVVSQPACQIAVEYPFSQASLPFIQSTNFDFRAWITSSVIFLSSPLSLHSVIRQCILYFFPKINPFLTMK